ncbi:MAG: SDR family NAD(P)-dependent oxidoreductase, partial [Clostridia bacterium]|nr:SDR family NAD(P)-dependent oxidoreductase [Clostridia bacterium]
MVINYDKKVVVVTGAAGGLGRAMVENFAKCGATVAACDLKGTAEKMSDLLDAGNIHCYDCDVSNAQSVSDAMDK